MDDARDNLYMMGIGRGKGGDVSDLGGIRDFNAVVRC